MLDKIPAIERLQADPFTSGQVLTTALGGDEMLKRLANDPDNLIFLDCDDKADALHGNLPRCLTVSFCA